VAGLSDIAAPRRRLLYALGPMQIPRSNLLLWLKLAGILLVGLCTAGAIRSGTAVLEWFVFALMPLWSSAPDPGWAGRGFIALSMIIRHAWVPFAGLAMGVYLLTRGTRVALWLIRWRWV
jgi:hypothetical protein